MVGWCKCLHFGSGFWRVVFEVGKYGGFNRRMLLFSRWNLERSVDWDFSRDLLLNTGIGVFVIFQVDFWV